VTAARPEADIVFTLDELDIEQVDENVVEDTFETRRLLRECGYYWVQIFDYYDDETNSGDKPRLLQVYNPEQQRALSLDKLARRGEMMEDPEDPWSEYVSPVELLADSPAPWWVKRSGARWAESLARGQNPAEHGQWLPSRCKSIKRDGTRCLGWAGSTRLGYDVRMCRTHLGQTAELKNELYVKTARQKLLEAGVAAADELEALLGAELETVRLRAATEILDRIGVKGGEEWTGELTVTHVDATSIVRDRLEKLRESRMARIKSDVAELVEGTVVE